MAGTIFFTPIGRMVGGNCYKMFPKKDAFGKIEKDAQGKTSDSCSIAIAIPKAGSTDWRQTDWGAIIFSVGKSAHPQNHMLPSYAWKIVDGDSAVPNDKNKKPCDNVNYRGHWILWLKQSWLPKLCSADGAVELTAPDAIVPGYYIRAQIEVTGNTGPKPGVYLNPRAIALIAEGEKIASEVDTSGFASLPPSQLPPGATPIQPAVTGFGAPAPTAPAPAAPAPGVVVQPNATYMAPAPAVPAPVVPTMTAKAGGATYQSFIDAGWTPEMMRREGYLL